jgi:Domain of unknown function (DUF4249)
MIQKVFFVMIMVVFIGCSKNYDITLPPNKSELMIECYLENGQPMRALISESVNLLDTSTIPPIFIQALVVISHGGVKDTLIPFPYIDTLRRKAYNYGKEKNVVANFTNNEVYRIDVFDNKGRHAYATTQFLEPVTQLSLTPIFNAQQKAYCLTKFKDNPATSDYYRLLINKNALYDSTQVDALFDNNFVNTNNEYVFGSGYSFKSGDTINARVFHLTEDHHSFINTVQNALAALVNPFAASGEIVSNVKGGIGIFAALTYTQKSIRVP